MNDVYDRLSKGEYLALRKIYMQHKSRIGQIKEMPLCFGDKARLLVKEGIIDKNLMYARKLLEMR